MALSMYASSVPVFTLGLTNLAGVLTKGEAHATAKNIEPSVFINARLYPDMFPLSRQVQIACDVIKGGSARLAGVEIPSFPDTEATFGELQARIQKTIDFIGSIPAAKLDGAESKEIKLTVGGNDLAFVGQDYLFKFVLPNLHFHTTATYAILRHNGVDVGKLDFLGKIQ